MRNNDWFSRILGVLVFLTGIGLLICVFRYAHMMFTSDTMGLTTTVSKGMPAGTATAALGESAIKIFIRIVLLLIMSAVGSLISSKGISMYFAATKITKAEPETSIKD